MLIALMRDVYLQVRVDEEDVFLKGRAMIIIEIESLMTTKQLDRWVGGWVAGRRGPTGSGSAVGGCVHEHTHTCVMCSCTHVH